MTSYHLFPSALPRQGMTVGMLPIAASKSYRYTVHSCALFDFAGYWLGIEGIRPFSKVIRCNSIRVVIDRFVADAHTVCIHSKTLEAGSNTRKGQ